MGRGPLMAVLYFKYQCGSKFLRHSIKPITQPHTTTQVHVHYTCTTALLLNISHCAGGKRWELIQRICFHYMVTLYSMYPVKLVAWAQTLRGDTPSGQFVLKYGRMLKLHAALLQPSSSSSVSHVI